MLLLLLLQLFQFLFDVGEIVSGVDVIGVQSIGAAQVFDGLLPQFFFLVRVGQRLAHLVKRIAKIVISVLLRFWIGDNAL